MPRTGDMIESKFLKKEDVGEDGTIVTVGTVTRVNVAMQGDAPEYRWTMQFDEFEKPMVLNSTNIKLAEKIFASDNTDDWIGKKLVAYNDQNVTFGKDIVGGIRLKAYRKAAPPREMVRNGVAAASRNVDRLDEVDPPWPDDMPR